MLTNPVIISVILMTLLCLMRLNVILSLIISAISAGVLSGISIDEIMNIFIKGMGIIQKQLLAIFYWGL